MVALYYFDVVDYFGLDFDTDLKRKCLKKHKNIKIN